MKKWLYGLAILVLAGLGVWWHFHRSTPAVSFRTDTISRGDLVPTISATGTVEPQEVVDVGAQVEGLIIGFGTDANGKQVDYGSPVEANTVLARIDDTLYAADAANARATLDQANAGVTRAVADLAQMQAKLEQAKSDWDRAQKLGTGDALSQSDYNTYKATYDSAVANVAVDEASIQQAKATVLQAQAALKRAEQNLAYCTISSPVKGVIIDRRVNIGETVVSSLNSPSLFLIAKDLKQIQVWVSVNEADIGNIHVGQSASFTVDAYPNDVFRGKVGKIRLNASMTQNVVTYTVEVNTDNSDGRLLPYLSANVNFEISNHPHVLLVPNSALRWYPEVTMVAPENRARFADLLADQEKSETNHKSGMSNESPDVIRQHGTVWVKDGEYVRPVVVQLGESDSIVTELRGGDLKEGDKVVSGVEDYTTMDSSNNPFAPQIFRHRH